MEGRCLVVANATTVYDYTNANCTPGNVMPTGTYTRDTYILVDGVWLRTARASQTISGTSTQIVTARVPDPRNDLGIRDVLLPAVLLIICLFSLILKMFTGVRR